MGAADRLAEVMNATPRGESVLIHGGSGNRIGALWALYQYREGVDIERAIELGRAAGMKSETLEMRVRELAGQPGD